MVAAFYALVLGLLLTACTSMVPVSKPGSTEADWRQVDYVYLRDSTIPGAAQRDRRLYEACLNAHGWTVAESGTGVARQRRGGVARLTDPAWTACRRVAGIWGNRPRTLSPQAATAGMVRAVVGPMSFSACPCPFPCVPRKDRHT